MVMAVVAVATVALNGLAAAWHLGLREWLDGGGLIQMLGGG